MAYQLHRKLHLGSSWLERCYDAESEVFFKVVLLQVKVTADVAAAQKFASTYGQVVVKPRASSGGDGVWLCSEDDDAWLGLCHVPSCHDLSLIASTLPHFCNTSSR